MTTEATQRFSRSSSARRTKARPRQARWHVPTAGRFISRDPLGFAGGDANLYRYCGNVPVSQTDPTGLIPSDRPPAPEPKPGGTWVWVPGQKCIIGCHGHGEGRWKWVLDPPPTNIAWSRTQAALIKITASAGNSPTDGQLSSLVKEVLKMYGGNSTAALGEIEQIRDVGIDNEMLAALDHYFNARSAVEASGWLCGLMAIKALIANAVYSGMKALQLPVPQDTARPPSQVTLFQWMAGNYGAAAGLLPPETNPKPK
jgi:RHS repeat-associated protein